MSDGHYKAAVSLVVNGAHRRWSVAGDSTETHYDNAANQDLVRLMAGDKVWMAVYQGPAELHPHHTTFAGIWLNE